MFSYDWFHGPAYQEQKKEARRRCTASHFPDHTAAQFETDKKACKFRDALEIRTLIFLRDGFSYEVKEIAEVQTKSLLVFECTPVDDSYKVGAFVVSLPYEEIVRVEVYAVHPSEKPEDVPQITGFRNHPEQLDYKYAEPKPAPPGR